MTVSLRPALAVCCIAILSVPISLPLAADEPAKAEATTAELIKKLEQTLTGCKMVGSFTVTGKGELTPKAEEYTITSAMKLEEPDLWLIKARIKYGTTDKTLPIPLEIKWAGDTPVITLTNLTIPGMGTFSSRVVIYEGRYAGTWQHDAVGGHLFGTLEKAAVEEDKPEVKPAEGKKSE